MSLRVYQNYSQAELRTELQYVLLSLAKNTPFRETRSIDVRVLRARKAYLLRVITPITH